MSQKSFCQNQKGFATIELVAFLILFVAMTGFLFGFWGVFHAATLNSIAARAYAYETFRHRTHLNYFRIEHPDSDYRHFYNIGFRRHHIVDGDGGSSGDDFYARFEFLSLNLGLGDADENEPDSNYRNETLYQEIQTASRYSRQGVNPIWFKINYGICIHPGCGDETWP